MAMADYEKLGVFYLGREYDLERRQPGSDLLLYDSKDLCTHGVCVGMTGSGKTGLCLDLLEEAAIDGIPSICIDPKGDLGNLLLAFPKLRPEDFLPWIDLSEATRQGMTPDEYATATASRWKQGLAEWDQPPERIQRFVDAVDLAIYTPGGTAGLPLTVMRSFTAPAEGQRQDTVALRERIAAAVSGLLALMGIDADPLKSREHILLSNIFDQAWRAGKDLELGALIRQIQTPPFDRLGVLDLDSFFPAQERFQLAMQLNNLLASPGFAVWREGEQLDIQQLLYTATGKPRVSILSIAHLSDAERMFFVTILLNEMVSWMRKQSGTSSLRALLYMDEVFGFFPPTANPPSKIPMLTLLKQARAFGLGIMLATQNPVDLDYKGLSNCGTWFLGRLQTERDKLRILDGLEGASATAGGNFDRGKMERIISGLGNRVFLMHNVHDDQPVVFQSRWALSYLRGPLTQEHVRKLMAPRKAAAAAQAPAPPAPSQLLGGTASHPVLPPEIVELFLPRRSAVSRGVQLIYRPGLLGSARVHFENKSAGIDESRDVWLVVPLIEEVSLTIWDLGACLDDHPDTESHPEEGAGFASLPGPLAKPKTYSELSMALKDHLYRTQRVGMWKCAAMKETSTARESEGDFRARLAHRIKEQRDLQVEKLRMKYAPRLAAVQEQLRKAEQRVAKEKQQASSQTMNAVLQFGSTILGAMLGRKLTSVTNINKAATTMRSAAKVASERQDVAAAGETVAAIQQKLDTLNKEFQAETEKVQNSLPDDALELEELSVRPKKADITVTKLALAWIPCLVASTGAATPAWE